MESDLCEAKAENKTLNRKIKIMAGEIERLQIELSLAVAEVQPLKDRVAVLEVHQVPTVTGIDPALLTPISDGVAGLTAALKLIAVPSAPV
jgi:hypothetical protein